MSWDKRWMRRNFAGAAPHYDRLAGLQRQIGEKLLSDLPREAPRGWMADVGAGTGWCGRQMARRYPSTPLLVLDIAVGMVEEARKRPSAREVKFVAGDIEALPLASASVALVISNLALQWCLDPDQALREMARVLPAGGHLLLSTFVSGTLEELRLAWSEVDDYSHVNEFISLRRLRRALASAGFREWRVAVEPMTLGYATLRDLFRDLKGIGAHNVTSRRPRHMLGKGRLNRLESLYPRQSGRLVATFLPAYVSAVK